MYDKYLARELIRLVPKSLFFQYDTVIVDLDNTLWDCYSITGRPLWAKNLTPPFFRLSDYACRDNAANVAVLQPGVKEALLALSASSIDLGALTVGGLENTPFYLQPAVALLGYFHLFELFNNGVVVAARTADKRELLQPAGRTLFIDDDFRWVQGALSRGDVDVLDRRKFDYWSSLFFDERMRHEIQVQSR